jgi:hypothetical protein
MAREFRDVGIDLEYLAAIRAALPADGFFVEEICQAGFASYFGFGVHAPRQFVTCGHQGTLGFGYPTSLGVKAAFPDRAVVSIAGDGGFMFGVGELATAVQHDLGVVAVVFNNDSFGNVLLDQRRMFAGREVGARLHNPDFAAVARAFGAAGYSVRSPGDLEAALTKALADGSGGRPAVIEVKTTIGGTASPWKYLMPGWNSTVLRQPRREAPGRHRPPAHRRDAQQRLPLPDHGLPVLVPVGMLAGYRPEVLDKRLHRLGHVEHLGDAVGLHPGAAEVIGQHDDADLLVTPGVAGLGPLRVGRHHDPPLGIDPAGDRRRLRPPVGSFRDHDRVVPWPDEVEQLISGDCGVDRDLGTHGHHGSSGGIRRLGGPRGGARAGSSGRRPGPASGGSPPCLLR